MNKKRVVALSGFLTFFSSLSFVNAQGPVEGLRTLLYGIKDLISVVFDFTSDILFNVDQMDEFLFAKVLLFLLIFIIVFTVLKKNRFFGDKRIAFIISAIVTILAVRFIPDNELVNGILLPYGTLGIALAVFMPFLIYFFFVHQSVPGSFGRRAAWTLFGIIFLVLWGMRGDEVGSANYIYMAGLGFVVISLIFDRSIHRYFEFSDFRRMRMRSREQTRRNYMGRLKKLERELQDDIISQDVFDQESKEINDSIRAL